MATILITGGTGLIGSALAKALVEKRHRIIVLTRKTKQSTGSILYKEWNVEKGHLDSTAISEADCLVHLAGANVADSRWTEKRKKEIVDSRVQSGNLLVQSLRNVPNKIKSVISA